MLSGDQKQKKKSKSETREIWKFKGIFQSKTCVEFIVGGCFSAVDNWTLTNTVGGKTSVCAFAQSMIHFLAKNESDWNWYTLDYSLNWLFMDFFKKWIDVSNYNFKVMYFCHTPHL